MSLQTQTQKSYMQFHNSQTALPFQRSGWTRNNKIRREIHLGLARDCELNKNAAFYVYISLNFSVEWANS